jgi:hypothetical protein
LAARPRPAATVRLAWLLLKLQIQKLCVPSALEAQSLPAGGHQASA